MKSETKRVGFYRAAMDQEQTRKRTMLRISIVLALFFLILLGSLAWREHTPIAFVYFLVALFLLVLFIYIGLTGDYDKSSVVGMTVMLIFYAFLFSAGVADQHSFVWYYTFPPLSMFLLGLRNGNAYSLTLISVTIAVHFFGNYLPFFNPYPRGLMVRMVFSYVAVHLIAYVYEQTRTATHSKLQAAIRELHDLAKKDGLTGLHNRRYQDEIVPLLLTQMGRSDAVAAFFMADVDYFKNYNDTYGHQAGDDILQRLSDVLSSEIKRKTDYVFRYGGEEFAVLLMPTSREKAKSIGRTIVEKISALNIPHVQSPHGHITVSIGACLTETRVCHDYTTIIEEADKALYKAKKEGRNRFVCIERVADATVSPRDVRDAGLSRNPVECATTERHDA